MNSLTYQDIKCNNTQAQKQIKFSKMNKLEKVVLDQHARVKSAGENGHEVLNDAKGEILSVATPELTQEVLDRTYEASKSQLSVLTSLRRSLYELSDSGLVVPAQGYIGLIVLGPTGQASSIHGFSAARGQMIQEQHRDPIQEACGPDFLYPPMMWAKALYSEAYNNRRSSQSKLPIQVWLAELAGEGLFQGSAPVHRQDGQLESLLGATGFMPSSGVGGTMAKLKRSPKRKEHLEAEKIKPFRASGLMDQAALSYLTSPTGIDQTGAVYLAGDILKAGGSLN